MNISRFPIFECIRKQILPCIVGQGLPKITILTKLAVPTSQMLNDKAQAHCPSGSGEDFKSINFKWV